MLKPIYTITLIYLHLLICILHVAPSSCPGLIWDLCSFHTKTSARNKRRHSQIQVDSYNSRLGEESFIPHIPYVSFEPKCCVLYIIIKQTKFGEGKVNWTHMDHGLQTIYVHPFPIKWKMKKSLQNHFLKKFIEKLKYLIKPAFTVYAIWVIAKVLGLSYKMKFYHGDTSKWEKKFKML